MTGTQLHARSLQARSNCPSSVPPSNRRAQKYLLEPRKSDSPRIIFSYACTQVGESFLVHSHRGAVFGSHVSDGSPSGTAGAAAPRPMRATTKGISSGAGALAFHAAKISRSFSVTL